MKKTSLDIYLLLPIKSFINKQTSVGILIIISAILAMIVANSPYADIYHNFWKQEVYIGYNNAVLNKTVLHWINDGLMSIFFFMVGLELKREIMSGELSSFRKALLPIFAAIGGMVFPALIFFYFNFGLDSIKGWGIPMATDIAFALGVLYLLGNKVPLSLKIFLTAIAVIDDLGAILVVAFFYTSEIMLNNLAMGGVFLTLLVLANLFGIRNPIVYAIAGIGGLWMAIMLSGVHATIAAVLAAFAIPTSKKINTPLFLRKVKMLSYNIKQKLNSTSSNKNKTEDEITNLIEKFSLLTQDATPPLQRLESGLHSLVSFIILPIFAFANAGITLDSNSFNYIFSDVAIGILLGLLIGKFIGIVLFTKLMVFFKISKLPPNVEWKHVYGIGFLAAMGFTMSLFITELAFEDDILLTQAKIGVLSASAIAGLIGYFYLRFISRNISSKSITQKSSKTTKLEYVRKEAIIKNPV